MRKAHRRVQRLAAATALLSAGTAVFAQHEQHEQHAPPAARSEAADHSAHAVSAADRAAAFPELGNDRMAHTMLENPLNKLVLLDRFESRDAAHSPLAWDLDTWIGRDLTKLWIRSSGERRDGDNAHADLELLWGRSVARWWDVLAGMRRDFEPSPHRTWAAVGVRGTAPYRLQVEATAYLGSGNRSALRLETQYEVLVTNRWILEPQLELEWYGHSDMPRGVGAGLAEGELGLRLRYEVRREVAPYVGLIRSRKFGETADLAGEDTADTSLVAGIRLWF